MADNTACSVEGCEKSIYVKLRGWCSRHYSSWHKYGDPLFCKTARTGEPEAFIETALKSDTDDCIEWPFSRHPYGHGLFGNPTKYAHRAVLEGSIGPCPDGLEGCHNCGNPSCVNPRHLRWDTHEANMRDKVKDGTQPRGERQNGAKLTEKNVLAIRNDPRIHSVIADDYGVTRRTIGDVKDRRTWAWLE